MFDNPAAILYLPYFRDVGLLNILMVVQKNLVL